MPKPVRRKLKRLMFTIEYGMLGRKKEVTGYEVVSGIAVDRRDSGWYVTHVPSMLGLVLSEVGSFKTRKEAVAYIRKLIQEFSGIDWTVDESTLQEEVSKAIMNRCQGELPAGGKHTVLKEALIGHRSRS